MGKYRKNTPQYEEPEEWQFYGESPSLDIATLEQGRQKIHLDHSTPRFDHAIKKCPILSADIPINNISFYNTKDALIGEGGFARIYKAYSGKDIYALKLFFNEERSHKRIQDRDKQIEAILNNVNNHKDIFKEEPFLAPKIISGANWLLMEYFEGITIQEHIDKGTLTESTRSQAIQTYMGMQMSVHSKNMIVTDNNWGGTIENNGIIKLCDYDLIMPIDRQNPLLNTMQDGRYHNSAHNSKRSITPEDDRESFMYMILAAYDIPLNIDRIVLQGDSLQSYLKSNVPKGLHSVITAIAEKHGFVSDNDLAAAVYKYA